MSGAERDLRTAAARAVVEMSELVAISSPFGDSDGAQRMIALCLEGLPAGASVQRLPCSTADCAPDLLATVSGSGSRRLLLLGHLDTVVAHADHKPARRESDRIYGSGTEDMKGGVALALTLMRELAARPEDFAELAVLLVCDEEWRSAPFAHVQRFTGYDACLCFEAGEWTEDGADGVIVERKGATTLIVEAYGRAAHTGSAPQDGRNALLALAVLAQRLAALSDLDGPQALSVVPTVIRSGGANNVVPDRGKLTVDSRAASTDAFARLLAAVPAKLGGVTLDAQLERIWPALRPSAATAALVAAASECLGRPIVSRRRGGASDVSHLAPLVPICIDGLGPCGGGAHTPDEYVEESSFLSRLQVALALAEAVLAGRGPVAAPLAAGGDR